MTTMIKCDDLHGVVEKGTEAEVMEALRVLESRFKFLSGQLDAKIRQLECDGQSKAQGNSKVSKALSLVKSLEELFKRCKEEATTEDGNVRKHLVSESEVPCTRWLEELRDCLRDIKSA